jgi:hypothetical protein
MRRISITIAIACAVIAANAAGSANAMTISTPAAVMAAIEGTNVVEEVAYACRRIRRCNVYGVCRVRRVCRVW